MRLVLAVVVMVACGASRSHAQINCEEDHYALQRDVYRLELSGSPRARVICTAQDVGSLDPTTAINDLLSTLATIALSRGEMAAKEYARALVTEICDSLKISRVINGLNTVR
jgi:hypothetical protein